MTPGGKMKIPNPYCKSARHTHSYPRVSIVYSWKCRCTSTDKLYRKIETSFFDPDLTSGQKWKFRNLIAHLLDMVNHLLEYHWSSSNVVCTTYSFVRTTYYLVHTRYDIVRTTNFLHKHLPITGSLCRWLWHIFLSSRTFCFRSEFLPGYIVVGDNTYMYKYMRERERERGGKREIKVQKLTQYNIMQGEQPLLWVTTPFHTSACFIDNFEFSNPIK